MNMAQLLGLATAGAMVAAEVSRKKKKPKRGAKKGPECTPCAAQAYVDNLKQFSNGMRGHG